ncbi:MAG: helix-turn-helix transcriptional regulator [Gemmatimonadaceae bacterium]|nr:helix-turn-helix transcriptional regulator [Gemmatimonadaceae bacterium]
MPGLDALLGGSGLACCLLLAVLAWRDAGEFSQGRVLGALAVSVSAQLLALSPAALLLPDGASLLLRLLGAPNVGLLWWFCLGLLRDGFRPGRVEWAGGMALALVPLVYLLVDAGVPVPQVDAIAAAGSLPPLMMVGHVVTVALRGRASDLLEPRRRARSWLAFALVFALVVSLATEELSDAQLASVLRNALVVVPMSVLLLLWLTRLQVERLQFLPVVVGAPVARPAMDPRDIALHRRLTHALDADACYLDAGLTIDGLADRLRAPVQQVRALINTGLGHRNFPAFLNEYRVAHAKRLLADPERGRDTVLAVAMHSGFASLATFNRVFREVEGSTPTAFRAAALARQLPENADMPRES